MLKVFSYLNITLALLYFFLYLLNSNSVTITAILLVIIHNGVVLKSVKENRRFTFWHFVLAMLNLVFAGFLLTWLVNIIRSSLQYDYFANSWLYILISSLLILSILFQLLAMRLRKY